MNLNLLGDGLVLLVLGLGMVFAFLTIMVGMMTLTARILSRFSHLFPPDAPSPPKKGRAAPSRQADDKQLIAVLTAAVRRYRSENR